MQDDWQVTPRMKLLYGLRYDLFDVPSSASRSPPIRYSHDFTIDKNNIGAARRHCPGRSTSRATTVLRASTGLMYEPPLLDFYDNAILSNGDPRAYTRRSVAGADARRRAGVSDQPGQRRRAGFVLPRQSITAVDTGLPDAVGLADQRAARARAVQRHVSVAVGYVNSIGRNLPVLIDVNLMPTGATLADGRPIYSTSVSAATRVDPTFDHVNVFQSIGESTYNAFTATLAQADDARLAGAGHLHARARRRQRAAHRHLRRRQRRRSRVGSVEPRSRQGRDAVQPDAHARRLGA